MRSRRPALALLAAVLAGTATACSNGQGAAGPSFEPVAPGVLTVATAFLPAPGFWEGNPPTKGFEAQLAAALAHRLGLDRVAVKQVSFGSIVGGHLHGADLALSQLTPTAQREKRLDFSTPYLTAAPGVLARRDVLVSAVDVKSLRGLRWVVSRLSTLTPIVMSRIRPTDAPVEVQDRAQALAVLRQAGADVLMLDLPVALGLAHAHPDLYQVLGQLDSDEGLAAALPNGSPNLQVVDSAIRHLQADGTIDHLVSRFLGGNLSHVPLVLTEG
jgi:polar amino acid transport system substrate-binding protein